MSKHGSLKGVLGIAAGAALMTVLSPTSHAQRSSYFSSPQYIVTTPSDETRERLQREREERTQSRNEAQRDRNQRRETSRADSDAERIRDLEAQIRDLEARIRDLESQLRSR